MTTLRHDIFRPNSKKTGHKLNVNSALSSNKKEIIVYASFVKQIGWDETKQVGIFYDSSTKQSGAKKNITLSVGEMAEIVSVIDATNNLRTDPNLINDNVNLLTASFFHKSDKSETRIKFAPLVLKDDKTGNMKFIAFMFEAASGTGENDKFRISLGWGDAFVIRQLFQTAITEQLTLGTTETATNESNGNGSYGGNSYSNGNGGSSNGATKPQPAVASTQAASSSSDFDGDDDLPF